MNEGFNPIWTDIGRAKRIAGQLVPIFRPKPSKTRGAYSRKFTHENVKSTLHQISTEAQSRESEERELKWKSSMGSRRGNMRDVAKRFCILANQAAKVEWPADKGRKLLEFLRTCTFPVSRAR